MSSPGCCFCRQGLAKSSLLVHKKSATGLMKQRVMIEQTGRGSVQLSMRQLEPISQTGNGRVAPALALAPGARRENILDLRPTSNAAAAPKPAQPGGLISGGRLAALLLSHRALWPCSFVVPCQLARQNPARPLPIYEMGSSVRVRLSQAGLEISCNRRTASRLRID